MNEAVSRPVPDPSRAPENTDERQGQTIPSREDDGESGKRGADPRLPHERDESADSQASHDASQRDMGEQAADDVADGRRDTSKGDATDEVYNRNFERGDAPPRP